MVSRGKLLSRSLSLFSHVLTYLHGLCLESLAGLVSLGGFRVDLLKWKKRKKEGMRT